jgi:phosphoglycerate kinase
MPFRTLDTADLAGKRALVRVDFNVPVDGGKITDDTRLRAALPTIHYLSTKGAKVILLAHFDRPKGKVVPEMSLAFVAEPLGKLLEQEVAFAATASARQAKAGGRTPWRTAAWPCWKTSASTPAKRRTTRPSPPQLAANGDLYVNDAFSAAHRAHASTEALARLLPSYPGLAMQRELDALDAALGNPKKPVLGIVGGSKVSTKLDLLNNLVAKLDRLAIGGGMANTFLFAQGHDVGGSLCEKDLADTARQIIATAERAGCELLLPIDVVVAKKVAPGVDAETRDWPTSSPTT